MPVSTTDLWFKTFYDERWPVRIAATSSATAALRDRRTESGVGRWVGRGHRAPAHRVEEGGERLGVVQALGRVGQVRLGPDLGARLHLPVDGERIGPALVVDGNELDRVMSERRINGRQPVRCWHGIRVDNGFHHPKPVPHPNQIPLLRHSHRSGRLNQNHLPGHRHFSVALNAR